MNELVNPALSELKFLVGDWDMELSNAVFLPDPTQKVNGQATFEIIENGTFLAMRQAGAAVWVIGRDEDVADYEVLYYDDRKVSRVYKMSFNDNIWKMWRESPGFHQRFEGKVSEDKKTVKAYWEKSADGKQWERDFDMLFTKV
jgi:hypothetical protein